MEKEELSDYYVKLGVSSQFSDELSNITYLIKELRRIRNSLNNYRQEKAELRARLYEIMISLRLGIDRFKGLLPEHDVQALKKKIEEIRRYDIRSRQKKASVKKAAKKKEKPKKKSAGKSKKEKKSEKDLLESEKRELELLRKDLENISKELKGK